MAGCACRTQPPQVFWFLSGAFWIWILVSRDVARECIVCASQCCPDRLVPGFLLRIYQRIRSSGPSIDPTSRVSRRLGVSWIRLFPNRLAWYDIFGCCAWLPVGYLWHASWQAVAVVWCGPLPLFCCIVVYYSHISRLGLSKICQTTCDKWK